MTLSQQSPSDYLKQRAQLMNAIYIRTHACSICFVLRYTKGTNLPRSFMSVTACFTKHFSFKFFTSSNFPSSYKQMMSRQTRNKAESLTIKTTAVRPIQATAKFGKITCHLCSQSVWEHRL